jgi:RNA polymerase sigma-70 factor (ECF subfamily)
LDAIREQSGLDPLDQDDSPDDRLLRQEEVHRVRQALQTLSEEHRSILILREMQDMAYEDIAQVLDINIGTVRSRLSRARAQMKSALEQIG